MIPHLGIEEVDRSLRNLIFLSILSYGIHYKRLVGIGLFHAFDKVFERLVKIDTITVVVVSLSTVAQLVYLITVEIKHGIDIAVLLNQIIDPGLIARVDNIDAALERRAQFVAIFQDVLGILEQVPLLLHTVIGRIGQGTVGQVIEQRLHAILMRLLDVPLYGLFVAVAIDDVGPHLHRGRRSPGQGFVVLIVPVLELHIIDVVTVQIGHDIGDVLTGHVAIGRKEPVAGESVGQGRYIDSDTAVDCLYAVGILAVQVDQIALIVSGRRLPSPVATRQGSLFDSRTQMTIAHHDIRSTCYRLVQGKIHSLARCIASLVGIELYLHVTIAVGDGVVLHIKTVASRNRQEDRQGEIGQKYLLYHIC